MPGTAETSFSASASSSPAVGFVTPSASLTEGLRRSASTRITRAPLRLRDWARLTAMVVLPSPGMVLVTRMVLYFVPASVRSSLMRRERMPS